MDATKMFLVRHERMHARVDALSDGLTELQVRERVHPQANPIAWHLWHMARVEDAAINTLITCGTQVFDETWAAKLKVSRRDVGAGMTMDEVVQLSRQIDLASLRTYRAAVSRRTVAVVPELAPAQLDEVVSDEQIRRAVVEQGIVEGATGPRLQEFWRGMTKGYFLVYLPFTHIYEHIGQVDLLRGLLGRPGPF